MKKQSRNRAIVMGTILMGIAAIAYMPVLADNSAVKVETIHTQEVDFRESVSASGSIMYFENKWVLSLPVNERDIRKVKEGCAVTVTGVALDGEYSASVSAVSDTARKTAAMETVIDVTVTIDEPDRQLRSGYSATGKIYVSESEQISVLPYSAIAQDDSGEYVFVVSNGRAEKIYIDTGRELSDGIEITGGISPDSEVIMLPDTVSVNAIIRRTTDD